MNKVRKQIKALPKADVHNHLHLGGSLEMLKMGYPNSNLSIPNNYNGLDGMIDFINNHINTVMLSSGDMLYFMEMALKNSIADNVTYLEASIDIGFVRFFNNSIEELLKAVQQLKNNYQAYIDFRPDIGINKDYALEKVHSDGLKCIDSGLFGGIDLYGRESNRKLDGFADIFSLSKKNGLKTKVHIGEFSSFQSINNTITLLEPTEIQHGIRAVDSIDTMKMIVDQGIQLNICPQSNISLGAVKSISEHPIRKLYDYGVKLTINTDDRLLFNASLTDQYVDLLEQQIFTFEEIDSIRKNGLA